MAVPRGNWGGMSRGNSSFAYQSKTSQTPKPKKKEDNELIRELASSIPGLIFVEDFVTEEEEFEIVKQLDAKQWSEELKRRVQHYGYKFDYATQEIVFWADKNNTLPAAEPMPDFLENIRNRLVERNLFPSLPDQLIVNEYQPGQGIGPHIDKTHCFSETIGSISLLSSWVMEFTHMRTFEKKKILLPRRSAVILTGDARYKWTHGIIKSGSRSPKHIEEFNGKEFQLGRRISLTYRIMTPEYLARLS